MQGLFLCMHITTSERGLLLQLGALKNQDEQQIRETKVLLRGPDIRIIDMAKCFGVSCATLYLSINLYV